MNVFEFDYCLSTYINLHIPENVSNLKTTGIKAFNGKKKFSLLVWWLIYVFLLNRLRNILLSLFFELKTQL